MRGEDRRIRSLASSFELHTSERATRRAGDMAYRWRWVDGKSIRRGMGKGRRGGVEEGNREVERMREAMA